MESMNLFEIDFLSPEYDESLALRNAVLRIPLGMQFDTEQLEDEYNQTHLACFKDNCQMIGCLVMKPMDADCVQMRQVAVSFDYQKKGVGKALVDFSEEWAKQNRFSKIILHARDEAVPFYKKLNYLIEGDPFTEIGIKHYNMYKNLPS